MDDPHPNAVSGGVPDIEVRRARMDELHLVEDFVDETYGAGAPYKQRARLRWQFVENPYRWPGELDPTIFVATCGGRIIGTIAVQDGRATVDGSELPMGWVVDVMVHPDWRGLGLGHCIHAAALDDRPTLMTLTMAEATRRIAERAGCMTLGPTREFVRPVRISTGTVRRFLTDKAANGRGRKGIIALFNSTWVGPALLAAGTRLVKLVRRPESVELAGYVIEEVDRFPAEVDVLWKRVSDAHPTMFERSERFLNWRFVDAPELVYRRFLLRSGDTLRGYVVTRVATEVELPFGTVVDMLAAPGDSDALDALLAHACSVLVPHCEYLDAAASSRDHRGALERAGFVATRTMRPTIVCTDPEVKRCLEAHVDDWHLTKGDHDWDQVHPV